MMFIIQIFEFKYDLGQKYYVPQVRPEWGSNSWPPDHDSTFPVTDACANHLAISDFYISCQTRLL